MKLKFFTVTFWLLFLVLPARTLAQGLNFKRGDLNMNDAVSLTDVILMVKNVLFGLDPVPFDCQDSADIDDNGLLEIADGIYLITYLFLDGQIPPEPFTSCGRDPSADELTCSSYEGCEQDLLCLSQELLEEVLGPLPGFSLCLPAGFFNLPLENLEVSVCPEEAASPCGRTETPGCPMEISSMEPFVDFDQRRVGIRIEGRIEDLPIQVKEPLFGTTTTCLNDFRGSAEDQPFSFEIVIPLITEEVEPGLLEITGLGQSEIANIDMVLDATGGLLCVLFEAGQGVFIELLLEPLATLVESITGGIGEAVIGLQLCLDED